MGIIDKLKIRYAEWGIIAKLSVFGNRYISYFWGNYYRMIIDQSINCWEMGLIGEEL